MKSFTKADYQQDEIDKIPSRTITIYCDSEVRNNVSKIDWSVYLSDIKQVIKQFEADEKDRISAERTFLKKLAPKKNFRI